MPLLFRPKPSYRKWVKNKVFLYRSGLAEPVDVEIGIRTESQVQVLKGLSVGDTVITSGVMQLRTGMKVSIDNLK